MQHAHLVVMAGGTGQRFWPWSSQKTPKQFQDLLGQGKSLLQITLDRFKEVILPTNVWVITQAAYRHKVQEQVPWLAVQQILDEPMVRNTAPCIAYACYTIAKYDPAAQLIFTPADHTVGNLALFIQTIQQALVSAQQTNKLMLIGTPCFRPESGYGYIAFQQQAAPIKPVINFVEKPSRKQALGYIQQGNYAWNTGIFIGNITTFISQYQKYLPKVWYAFQAIDSPDQGDIDLHAIYQAMPAVSFDQAILEKTKDLYMLYKDLNWSDLGTWNALYEYLPKDDKDNLIQGKVVALDTQGCLIRGDHHTLIATYGVKDLVIVAQDDVLLICPREAVQNIKALTQHVEAQTGKDYV